jgi:Arc/MetJ family transcription regulator
MTRRTTIEIDENLLERARVALGCTTMRATVEEALRQASDGVAAELDRRTLAQKGYLERLATRADLRLLASDQMWE